MGDPNANMMSLQQLFAFDPTANLPGAGVVPQTVAQPQLSPTAQYVQNMQALISGGIGKLSTGEKLGALGQILQAAGSRGAADPAAVLQNVRNQQMQKLNAQYQIALMQQKMQEEAQQRVSVQKYSELLTENERAALEGLPLDKRAEKINEIAFREKRVQEIKRGADGKTRYVYSDGNTQIVDWSLPPKTKYENLGDKLLLIDEDTGKPVLDENGKEQTLKVNMSPAQAANYGLAVRREARIGTGDGGGGRNSGDRELPQPTVRLINGKPTYAQWDKRAQKYVPFSQPGLTPPTAVDPLTLLFGNSTGTPKFQRR